MKQHVRIGQYYDILVDLPDRFKVKHVDDLSRQAFHCLRHAELIEIVPDAMGKEYVWTLTDTAERMLEERGAEFYRWVPDLSDEQLRFLTKHKDTIQNRLKDVDDTFLSKEIEIDGRTPEGMRRYGIIEKVERRDGYPTVWSLTEFGEKVCRMMCSIE